MFHLLCCAWQRKSEKKNFPVPSSPPASPGSERTLESPRESEGPESTRKNEISEIEMEFEALLNKCHECNKVTLNNRKAKIMEKYFLFCSDTCWNKFLEKL